MASYMEFSMERGSIFIESEGSPNATDRGAIGAVKSGATTIPANRSWEDALGGVERGAQAFCELLSNLSPSPEQIDISFGVKAAAELGCFVVSKDSKECNFLIRLTWKKQK